LKADFKKLHGVDIGKGIIRKAGQLNPEVKYRVYNGKKLPYPDGVMDVVFAICVLHHIPVENLKGFSSELKRVLKKGGMAVIFEHNPYNPLTLRAVNDCDLDENAILIPKHKTKDLLANSGLQVLEDRYILFTPFGGAFFKLVDRFLGWLPLGAQYYVAAQK
jgi:SAM-dependent methyltransferase